MVKKLLIISIILGLFGIAACEGLITGPEEANQLHLNQNQRQLVDAGNSFSFDLFQEVIAQDHAGNRFISPLSVSMALGMTMNGAAGSTFDSMRAALRFDGLTRTEINESCGDLIEQLTGLDPKVTFYIANSVWTRKGFPVERQFIDVNRHYFDAEARTLDFGTTDAVETINGWVAEKTEDKISKLLDAIPGEVVMYLINALYFKGDWTSQFNPETTRDAPFYTGDDSEVTVRMMSQYHEFPYHATDTFQMIDLPYGSEQYSMTIMLPKEGSTLEALVAQLDASTWSQWIEQMEMSEGTIQIPRFRIAYKALLNDMLRALGLGIAFDGARADFSGISQAVYENNQRLFISRVLHNTFVQVDEEGTEAAAATGVEVSLTSVSPGFTMRVDRPFLFVIRERTSNTLLFIGTIGRPVWEENP